MDNLTLLIVVLVLVFLIYIYIKSMLRLKRQANNKGNYSLSKAYKCPNCGAELSAYDIKHKVCTSCKKDFYDENLIEQGATKQEINDITRQAKPIHTKLKNIHAITLNRLGSIIVFVGIVVSIGLADSGDDGSWLYFLLYLITFLSLGFFLMGFGEVIQILDDIRNK